MCKALSQLNAVFYCYFFFPSCLFKVYCIVCFAHRVYSECTNYCRRGEVEEVRKKVALLVSHQDISMKRLRSKPGASVLFPIK
jgi:hypothetical protein